MCADDESYVVVPRAETRRHGVSACDERVDDSPLPMRQEPLHQERHGTLPITQRVGKQMAMTRLTVQSDIRVYVKIREIRHGKQTRTFEHTYIDQDVFNQLKHRIQTIHE